MKTKTFLGLALFGIALVCSSTQAASKSPQESERDLCLEKTSLGLKQCTELSIQAASNDATISKKLDEICTYISKNPNINNGSKKFDMQACYQAVIVDRDYSCSSAGAGPTDEHCKQGGYIADGFKNQIERKTLWAKTNGLLGGAK